MNSETAFPMSTGRKMALLGSLYFSQGLPFGFFTQALPLLLREKGFSLSQIGLSSLLALPWALKFLWAPVVDRFCIARFGRRRSWIIPLQAASAATLLVVAFMPGAMSMRPLMGAVLLLNLIAATQDIATDGLAVDMLAPGERGFANGLQVAGYRVGMIIGGGLLLVLFDKLGAPNTFLAMAFLTVVATLPVIATREPSNHGVESASPGPTLHFLRRPGAVGILLLIFTYKLGDAFATGMLRPFLADAGLSLADVGWLLGTVGFVSGLLGALCGGAWVNRLGRKRALVSFGALQALTVAGYAFLAAGPRGMAALYVLCGAEHFAGGMATAALFTCMMDWCSRGNSATDYTIQASVVVIATGIASAVAGYSAQTLGYFAHFSLATVLAVASLWAVAKCFPEAQSRGQGVAQPLTGSPTCV